MIVVIALLVFAGYQAAGVDRSVYAARSATIAAETQARHPVEAVAVSPSTVSAQGVILAYATQVQWPMGTSVRDKVIRMDHPVKAGDRVRVWIDDEGNATTPPPTNIDARGDSIGAAALLWLAVLFGCSLFLAVLRRVLDALRYQSWDRELHALADDGRGRATHP